MIQQCVQCQRVQRFEEELDDGVVRLQGWGGPSIIRRKPAGTLPEVTSRLKYRLIIYTQTLAPSRVLQRTPRYL